MAQIRQPGIASKAFNQPRNALASMAVAFRAPNLKKMHRGFEVAESSATHVVRHSEARYE
jgi:hypothetical protein